MCVYLEKEWFRGSTRVGHLTIDLSVAFCRPRRDNPGHLPIHQLKYTLYSELTALLERVIGDIKRQLLGLAEAEHYWTDPASGVSPGIQCPSSQHVARQPGELVTRRGYALLPRHETTGDILYPLFPILKICGRIPELAIPPVSSQPPDPLLEGAACLQ